MKKILWLTILFLILLFSACKSYLPIDRVKPKVQKDRQSIAFEERQLEKLQVGDTIKIYQSVEDPLFLIFHSVSNDSIKGIVWKNGTKNLDIPIYSGVPILQIKAIEVRKIDSTKTWLVIGLAVPVLIIGITILRWIIVGFV